MKNIKITILIIFAFFIGALASNIHAGIVKLIQVPEYIGDYSTIELLNYTAKLKAHDDMIQNSIKASKEARESKSGVKILKTKSQFAV